MVYALLYHIPGIHKRTVLFESYHGRRMGDSPYAIFLRMMEQPRFQKHRFVWVLDDTGNPLARQFASRKNVKYVRRHSLRYLYYLCRSKYLFNNNTFPHYFQKKPGQIYVNTWHGTPLKTLGKDIRGTPGQHRNMARNFFLSDYFVNPNPFTADVLVRANDLGRLYTGLIVLEGYPRNDLLINADPNKVRHFLFEHCQVPPGPKIILYAPTWRGEIGKPEDTSEEIYGHIKTMRRLVPEGYILLLKVHGLTYRYVKEDSTLHDVICIPDWVETNELLSVVDVLVTDYSSIFFDFLCTGRPIVFFCHDREMYDHNRGLYLRLDDLPGPVVESAEEVMECIRDIDRVRDQYKERLEQFRQTYCGKDDGKATERILQMVFDDQQSENSYRVFDPAAKKVLLYGGRLINDKTISALEGLIERFEGFRFDVTLICDHDVKRMNHNFIRSLDQNIRVVYREGHANCTPMEYLLLKLFLKMGRPKYFPLIPRSIYQRELERLVGTSAFDIKIDLVPKTNFWSPFLSPLATFDPSLIGKKSSQEDGWTG